MRNLIFSLMLCGVAGAASAGAASVGCPAAPVAPAQVRPAKELISSAAAQAPLDTAAAQTAAVMMPASVHAGSTQLMGAPPAPGAPLNEPPRRGSRLAMVLAALGVMLLIVLRQVGALR
jgi:hypothetical protein